MGNKIKLWAKASALLTTAYVTSFFVRNDFSPIPSVARCASDSGISVTKRNSLTNTYIISADIESIKDSTPVVLLGLSANNDTLFKKRVLDAVQEIELVLSQNPCENGGKIQVFAENEPGFIAERSGMDEIIANFSPDAGKPVMIFFPSSMTSFASEATGASGFWQEKRDEDFFHALVDLFNMADQRDQLTTAKKYYGDNLLVIPELTKEELGLLGEKLHDKLARASSIQVLINGHHRSPTPSEADSLGYTGEYILGNAFKDRDLLNFIRALPGASQNHTVVHGGCNVRTDAFAGVGNHIVLAPYGTAMSCHPDFFGKVRSLAVETIPLLAKEASVAEIESALERSSAANRQIIGNYVQRYVAPETVRHPEVPISLPVIIQANSGLKR